MPFTESNPIAVDTPMSDEAKLVQRDERGRLLPGSALAKGRANPSASKVVELKNAMLDAVHPGTMTELTNRLIDLCRSPDGKIALAALELFLNRVLGKPRESIELDVSATTASANVNVATVLDAGDLAALESMRRKLAGAVTGQQTIDAEVIEVK